MVTRCQYSADGEKWDQSSNNLSSCRPQVRANHRLLAMTIGVTGILIDADVSSLSRTQPFRGELVGADITEA